MSVDDQLFKEDGTIITKIDIFILKLAKKIATFFADEDDETFTPVLLKVYKIGRFLMAGSIVISLFTGEYSDAVWNLFAFLVFLRNQLSLSAVALGHRELTRDIK